MTRQPIEVTRQDRIYCLKASSDYHRELCEECRFYPNCDHVTQDDMTELTIEDLEALEQEPCEDAVSVTSVFEIMGNLLSIPYDFDRNITEKDVSESMDKIRELPRVTPQEPRWIPVTERLPEEMFGCLVTVWDANPKTGEEFENILPEFAGYDGETWNGADGKPIAFEVVAWMPLPKSYRGDNNGK